MTDPPQQDPPAPDDRTRDIRLPPLPDRPPPALPKEWHGLPSSADAPTTAVPPPVAPPPGDPRPSDPPGALPPGAGSPVTSPETDISREEAAARIEARRLASQPTDELTNQPLGRRPDRTLSFSEPEMRHRPVEPVAVGRTARRWPWIVLTLLPILVIVGAAVAWVILLRGA